METSHDAWVYKFHVECMLTHLGDSFIYLDTTWGIRLAEFDSRVFSKSPGYSSDFCCFRNHMALFVASCHMKIRLETFPSRIGTNHAAFVKIWPFSVDCNVSAFTSSELFV